MVTENKFKSLLPFVIFTLAVFLFSAKTHAQEVYWYQDGEKVQWFLQDDMIAFKMETGNKPGILASPIVKAMISPNVFTNNCYVLFIDEHAPRTEVEALKSVIRNLPGYIASFSVITQDPGAPNHAGWWKLATEEIQLSFADGIIDSVAIKVLQSAYPIHHTGTINWPDGSSFHQFTIDLQVLDIQNAPFMAARLYESDLALFDFVEPNLAHAFIPDSLDFLAEVSSVWPWEQPGLNWNAVQKGTQIWIQRLPGAAPMDCQVFLMDCLGRKHSIKDLASGQTETRIDLNRLTSGLYFIVILDRNDQPLYLQRFHYH